MQYLSEETTKINLEHHYWLKDSFLSRIGKMAPNLKEICIRRVNISNASFTELVSDLSQVEKMDMGDCSQVESSGLLKFIENCGHCLEWLDASNCQDALTDEVVQALANIEEPKLTHLNLSYAKMITDEGLNAFEGKEFMIETLNLTGLTGVSVRGLYHPIWACRSTLTDYAGGLMDQEEMKPGMDNKVLEYGKALGNCWGL